MRSLAKGEPSNGAAEEDGSPHWTKRLTKKLYAVYALLLITSAYVLTDSLLPTRIVNTQVEDVSEMGVNLNTRARGWSSRSEPLIMTHWVLVTLRNGMRFQTENMTSGFPIGDTLDAEVTAFREEVVRYKLLNSGRYGWVDIEGANKEYLAFPTLVALCSLLLLLPIWSDEYRLLLNMILGLGLVAWLLTLIGTGVMKSFA